jgi:transcriptional regulator with XRE-family HTH domain
MIIGRMKMNKEIRPSSLKEAEENTFTFGEENVLNEPNKEESYNFPEILTALRGNRDRTIVAEELGISRSTLEYYEKGKRKPDIIMAYNIAKYYGVSLDYLIKGVSSDNDTVHEDTGLWDKAIDNLKKLRKRRTIKDKKTLATINLLLENLYFLEQSESFFDYLVRRREEMKIFEASCFGAYSNKEERSFLHEFGLFSRIEILIDGLVNAEYESGALTELGKKLEEKETEQPASTLKKKTTKP